MCRAVLVIGVAYSIFNYGNVPHSVGNKENLDKRVDRILAANTPDQLSHSYKDLFRYANTEDLHYLAKSTHYGIAFAVGWDKVRRTIREKSSNDADVDIALSRFIGLVEGRLRVPLPQFWSTMVQSAQPDYKHRLFFQNPEDLTCDTMPCSELPIEGLPKEYYYYDHRWMANIDGRIIQMPLNIGYTRIDLINIAEYNGKMYIASYCDETVPYYLHEVNAFNNEIMWSAQVWAEGIIKIYTGITWHSVELVARDDIIIVFGVSPITAYIEIFEENTGKNICRFSTIYFEE